MAIRNPFSQKLLIYEEQGRELEQWTEKKEVYAILNCYQLALC